jgi:hypothetical protein
MILYKNKFSNDVIIDNEELDSDLDVGNLNNDINYEFVIIVICYVG